MQQFELQLTASNAAWLSPLSDEDKNVHINAILSLAQRVMDSSAPTHVPPELRTELESIKSMVSLAIPRVMQNQLNSSVKGDDGEKSADDVIVESFPHLSLEDTSSSSKGGDRMLTDDAGCSILLEFKHYKSSVPTKEVEKFYRDLRLSSCKVGVFCSISSGICKKPKKITFEPCGSSIAVFIPHAGTEHVKLLTIIAWGGVVL